MVTNSRVPHTNPLQQVHFVHKLQGIIKGLTNSSEHQLRVNDNKARVN